MLANPTSAIAKIFFMRATKAVDKRATYYQLPIVTNQWRGEQKGVKAYEISTQSAVGPDSTFALLKSIFQLQGATE